jgi:hypothetical protein
VICAEELAMADEAFALSPISARPVQPGEADYDAIREAFMETSRGRWFLTEYAKRNRNADTRMVLDAVARIEETLAAQRQPAQDATLEEALAAMRSAVDEAAEAASAALTSLNLADHVAPIRKGTRIIKEISWRWREIGADGRICDLIDSQVDAIETGCARISEADPQTALNAAFALVRSTIDRLGEGDLDSPMAAAEVAAAPAAPADDLAPDAAAETAAPAAELDETSRDAAAEATADEAVLAMVAIEMAAPDPADDVRDGDADAGEVQAVLPPDVPPVVANTSEPAVAPLHDAQPPLQAVETPPERPAIAAEPSLGSTIIAAGLLQRPKTSSDPLAPIRRMSQVERIAFFS